MLWQFTFIHPQQYQMIPDYHYLAVNTIPASEYDVSAFKHDYMNSDYPQDKYFQVRDIQIVAEKEGRN